jgi:hypothetical protein
LELELAAALRKVASAHREEPDVAMDCNKFAEQSSRHASRVEPFLGRFGSDETTEPDRMHRRLFDGTRTGPLGLMRDLHDLYLMACECDLSWSLIAQGAQAVRDNELLQAVQTCDSETALQMSWLRSRMKQAAPQALVVAP